MCLNCFEGICGNINKNTLIYVRGKDFFSFLLLFTEMMCIWMRIKLMFVYNTYVCFVYIFPHNEFYQKNFVEDDVKRYVFFWRVFNGFIYEYNNIFKDNMSLSCLPYVCLEILYIFRIRILFHESDNYFFGGESLKAKNKVRHAWYNNANTNKLTCV